MRPAFALRLLVGGACFCSALPALAGMKVEVRTRTYAIAGTTGEALLAAMDRKGPKRGFMTHAIAQTGYTVDWELKVRRDGGGCRLVRADATLHLNYTYPAVESDMPSVLRRRWRRFIAGVHAHEEGHGRIARQMVRATERSISGLTNGKDRFCIKTRNEAKRHIDRTYARYEARQVAYDAREHGKGGRVGRLVAGLLGKR